MLLKFKTNEQDFNENKRFSDTGQVDFKCQGQLLDKHTVTMSQRNEVGGEVSMSSQCLLPRTRCICIPPVGHGISQVLISETNKW